MVGDRIPKDQLLWIDLESADADELKLARGTLKLDDGVARALDANSKKPDSTVHEGAVEVILLGLNRRLDDASTPLQVLVGDGWIVTNHAQPMPFLDEHRARIQDQREVGLLSPVQFLVSILNWHVESFFEAAAKLEAEVDELDDAALRTEKDLLFRLVKMRRRMAHVRRVQGAHREVYAGLARPDFLPALERASRRRSRRWRSASTGREKRSLTPARCSSGLSTCT